ncbi:MAG: RsmE family RNA methyltransferase [Candidatus Cloacimonadales bacterium]|nr:RsmE family RNA methyltransferase [Candidatus Cloacimonadales bacterium]
MPSFYTSHLQINDKNLTIAGEEFHHISHVFRKRIGDEILLTSGNGLLAKALIYEIDKKFVKVEILDIKKEKFTHPAIAVAFPLLKSKHDFLIVEKLTELGVKEFFPIVTNHSVRISSINTQDKFEKAAIAAIKQCDNAFLPKIHPTQRLQDFLENLTDFQPFAALETGKHKTLFNLVKEFNGQPICLIIGPEGGFDDEETELFKMKNITTFTLGNHILRAETAAIAAAAQIMAILLENNENYF